MSNLCAVYGFQDGAEAGNDLLSRMLAAQRTKMERSRRETPVGKYFFAKELGAGADASGFFSCRAGEGSLAAVLDGEFYNREELRALVRGEGETLETETDAELALKLYLLYGPEFVRKINGVFAMAVADEGERRLVLYRDRIGAKPLFYTVKDGRVYASSLIRGLFACPGVRPEADLETFQEIFALGPARTPGSGVFHGIRELRPAHMLVWGQSGAEEKAYWTLESHPHEDSYEKTVETVRELISDAVFRQARGRDSLCSFLSGGLDSSLVSSIASGKLKEQGKRLSTYSFDFKDNEKYFQANGFQPSRDRPYVELMAEYLDSDHHFLECGSETQVRLLADSVLAADLPVMADVDSSLLYFCSQTAKHHRTALTGECADEIFGGYPWFHRKEMLEADTFPWAMDIHARKALLKDEFAEELEMESYAKRRYEEALAEVPACAADNRDMAQLREISWLNVTWFMQTLLNRMDRTSRAAGLTACVPFADYRIIQYLWNVPREMKAKDGVPKSLLRESAKGLLPEAVLYRKKSPYPKTYVPRYEQLLAARVRALLDDESSPARLLLDREKTLRFLGSPSDYGRPWYGQLMAAPQMLAYVLQVDFWMREYQVRATL